MNGALYVQPTIPKGRAEPPTADDLAEATDAAWRHLDGLLREAVAGGRRVSEGLARRIEDASIHYDLCMKAMQEFEAR